MITLPLSDRYCSWLSCSLFNAPWTIAPLLIDRFYHNVKVNNFNEETFYKKATNECVKYLKPKTYKRPRRYLSTLCSISITFFFSVSVLFWYASTTLSIYNGRRTYPRKVRTYETVTFWTDEEKMIGLNWFKKEEEEEDIIFNHHILILLDDI